MNHPRESRLTLLSSLVLFLAAGLPSVSADDLVYSFKGFLPPGASSHTSVSDFETFTATFTIDPSVSDTAPSPTEGVYPDSIISGVLVFSGGYVAPLSFSNYDVLVFNDSGTGPVDGVSVREPGGNIIQASNRDLTILSSDALPPGGTEFQSGPDPDTVPFLQLFYSDAGGTISYTATTAHNVEFRAKEAIAWSNVTAVSSPWYDVSGNWLAGMDFGPPSDVDTALFSLFRTYDVWWDSITGDRTVEDLCVTNGNVTFDNQDGGTYTLTVTDDAEIDGPADLILGDGTDTVNLDISSFLIVDGDFNAFAGTMVTAGLSDVGRDAYGQVRMDGSGTVLQIGGSAMYVGVNDLGDLLVTNGAVVNDDGSPRLGSGENGNGLARVEGSGSEWNAMGRLSIGNFTDTVGFLTVIDNATVNVGGSIEAGFISGTSTTNSITVDDATLMVGEDIRLGGSGGAFLFVRNNGSASADGDLVIAPMGTVSTSGTGTPQVVATTIINSGQMLLDADIGADVFGNVINGGLIHSMNTAENFFYDNVIHDGFELRTDPGALTRFLAGTSVGGAGDYTGTGAVRYDGNFNPGPGSGIGTTAGISFDGDVNFNFGSILNIDIGSTGPSGLDHLMIAGDLSINSSASLSLNTIGGFCPCDAEAFLIVELDGTRTGTFSGLPEGALVDTFGPTDLFITYFGGDGNDIALNAVSGFLLGDVNLDCKVNLLDVEPFIDLLISGGFQAEADINGDGVVTLLDVDPFVTLLSGG